ncbi:MAG: hypothetical protein LC792_01040, partial [Actinobacteria bacterium]|nr:hypothetical protein [Actinomycetota bacterium]
MTDRPTGRWAGAGAHLAAALPAWLVARVLVLVALVLARALAGRVTAGGTHWPALSQGLLAWDGDWYLHIARHGYAAVTAEGLRFFPLFPLAARGLAPLLAGSTGAALLVLSNGGALVLGALVHRLGLEETGDECLARRAAWLVALVPPFFVLVMGYAEPIALSLAVAVFLAMRRRRWWPAAAAGLLAGLARPSGVVLALPVAVEAWRGLRDAGARERLARAGAVAAPLVGAGSYLAWVGARFGDPWLPLRAQQLDYLRGGTADPLATLATAAGHLVQGRWADHNIARAPWLLALAALVVVAFRRWPLPYGALAAATVAA